MGSRGPLLSTFDRRLEDGVAVEGDAVVDFGALGFVGVEEVDRFEEVAEEEVQLVAGDAHVLVNGFEGAAGVGAGGGTEGGGEEFKLHVAELVHGGVTEEGLEFGVGEDAIVEAIDEEGDADVAAEAVVEGGG